VDVEEVLSVSSDRANTVSDADACSETPSGGGDNHGIGQNDALDAIANRGR